MNNLNSNIKLLFSANYTSNIYISDFAKCGVIFTYEMGMYGVLL